MMYRYRKYSTIIESVILLQLCSLARLLGGVLKELDSCVAVLPDTSSRLRDRATCLLQRARHQPAKCRHRHSLYTVSTFPLDVVKTLHVCRAEQGWLAGEWDQLEECWQAAAGGPADV